jgi:subtilisin family serine protease
MTYLSLIAALEGLTQQQKYEDVVVYDEHNRCVIPGLEIMFLEDGGKLTGRSDSGIPVLSIDTDNAANQEDLFDSGDNPEDDADKICNECSTPNDCANCELNIAINRVNNGEDIIISEEE